MSLLANLDYDSNIENEKDVLGGGFKIFESNIYKAMIKLAYEVKAVSGAVGVAFIFDIDGTEYRETFYVTNKKGQNFYEKDGNRQYLAGFLHADAIALLAAGKPLSKLVSEKKTIKLYNSTEKKELPAEVDMLTELLNKEIKLGITKNLVFKQEKNAEGEWEDTEETRNTNNVDKVFRAKDDKTTSEVRAQTEHADFHAEWMKRWEGQVRDRTNGAKKTSGGAAPATAPRATSESLFS